MIHTWHRQKGFIAILENFQFKFLLVFFFKDILSGSVILFSIIHKSSLYISMCICEKKQRILKKKQFFDTMSNKFEECYWRVLDAVTETPENRGRHQVPAVVLSFFAPTKNFLRWKHFHLCTSIQKTKKMDGLKSSWNPFMLQILQSKHQTSNKSQT